MAFPVVLTLQATAIGPSLVAGRLLSAARARLHWRRGTPHRHASWTGRLPAHPVLAPDTLLRRAKRYPALPQSSTRGPFREGAFESVGPRSDEPVGSTLARTPDRLPRHHLYFDQKPQVRTGSKNREREPTNSFPGRALRFHQAGRGLAALADPVSAGRVGQQSIRFGAAREEGVPARAVGVVSLQLELSLAMGRAEANVKPPAAAVPPIAGAGTQSELSVALRAFLHVSTLLRIVTRGAMQHPSPLGRPLRRSAFKPTAGI
jgi:hypothetical protein